MSGSSQLRPLFYVKLGFFFSLLCIILYLTALNFPCQSHGIIMSFAILQSAFTLLLLVTPYSLATCVAIHPLSRSFMNIPNNTGQDTGHHGTSGSVLSVNTPFTTTLCIRCLHSCLSRWRHSLLSHGRLFSVLYLWWRILLKAFGNYIKVDLPVPHSCCLQDTELIAAAFNNHSSFEAVFFLKIKYWCGRFRKDFVILQDY